ncbi:MAG: NAD(+) synthase, partial [Deltaproteobacteria bacterium]|nr:NAD(+) synthase [Deltaproteobacteria bacterium]
LTGYGCEDEFHSRGLQQLALAVLAEVLPETRGLVVSVGLPLLHQHALFNAAALCVDGRLRGFVCKRFLAGDGIHYEPRWFKPWPSGERATALVLGEDVPLGDVHFDVGGVMIGFEICEDAWAAARPGGDLAAAGVDVILNPSASHFAFGKHEVRQRFVLEGSRAFGVTYVYANLLGNEAGRAVYDGGALIAANGRMCARGPRFSYATEVVTSAVVDLDEGRMALARTQSFRPRLGEPGSACVPIDFSWPDLEPVAATTDVPAWEHGPHLKEEEFTRAVALGLYDYLRKSRSRGFVVSLSGGADSAGVACLVAAAVGFGVAELGLEEFCARLPHARQLEGVPGVGELVRELLLCVYQATENSSRTTRDAARAVAEALSAEFLELDVDHLVKGYVDLVAGALGRRLDWEHDDLALQNIQARTRAPGVWLLANLRNALLLATSNRSEAAVGYATMDGDTCGGLSPIAGIDKAFLRRWLGWLERTGPAGLGALPALAAVTAQAPTAELRPAAAHQTDEDDLMPYEVLDAVERAAIRDKHTPVEVYRELRVRFPAVRAGQLREWVERFFRLWCRNQWKRERYAPSFHVDDENLDPKTWCRFPILSGGFERELRELREYAR